MNLYSKLVTVLLVAGLSGFRASRRKRRKLRGRSYLPRRENRRRGKARGATIRGFSTEVEQGKRLYEVELTVNGHTKDISMDEQGSVVEVEEEVSLVH